MSCVTAQLIVNCFQVVSPDEVAVMFVDYGNVERCKRSELRAADTRDFPLHIQCLKCRLDGIAPVSGTTSYCVAAG